MFTLGPRSKARLQGVNPDLVKVVERAIKLSEVDFTVIEGLRTLERQHKLVDSGASQTLKSRHLTGHAVDLAAWVDDLFFFALYSSPSSLRWPRRRMPSVRGVLRVRAGCAA